MQISALPFCKGDITAHIASSASRPFIKFLYQTQGVSDHVLCVLEGIYISAVAMVFPNRFWKCSDGVAFFVFHSNSGVR